MNTSVKFVIGLVAVVMAFATVSPVFASSDSPNVGINPENRGHGILSDYVAAAIADLTGLSVEEVQTRQEAGESLKEIAESTGVDIDMASVMQTAIAAAVADGVITAEQAEKMASHEGGKNGRNGAVLETLGITFEELQAMRESGMTMKEITEEQGVELSPKEGRKDGTLQETLGITFEELQAMRDSGMTMKEIAEEQGVELSPKGTGEGHPGGGPRK